MRQQYACAGRSQARGRGWAASANERLQRDRHGNRRCDEPQDLSHRASATSAFPTWFQIAHELATRTPVGKVRNAADALTSGP